MGYFKYWVNEGPKKIAHNSIASEGHLAVLDSLVNGTGGAGNLYIGLIDNAVGTANAFQTLADKDWNEFTNYREPTRQIWNRDAVDGQTVPNEQCNPAVFTVAADIQLAGFFITTTPDKGDTVGAFLSFSDAGPQLLYEHDRLFIDYTWEF